MRYTDIVKWLPYTAIRSLQIDWFVSIIQYDDIMLSFAILIIEPCFIKN